MPQAIRIISGNEVRRLLPMPRAIDAMAEAFSSHAEGQAEIPERIHLDSPDDRTTVLVMPSMLFDRSLMGLKLISLCDDNHAKGLPTIQAVVLIMDLTQGQVRAMIDGTSMTALRTGAASGLATRYLAREDAKVAAIFGAGVQGRTQLEGVCAARPTIERAMIFDPDEQATTSFAKEMASLLDIDIEVATDRSRLAEADIVCTATPSPEPLFHADDIHPGTHINAVGSYKITMHEIPELLVPRTKLVVDNIETCLMETADLILPIRHGLITREDIHTELGQLVSDPKLGRTDAEEITFFKSVGLAIQDLAAGAAVLKAAEAQNVGTVVDV